MEAHTSHSDSDKSLPSIDNLSLDDIERDIQNLRSFASRPRPPAHLTHRKTSLKSRHGSRSSKLEAKLNRGNSVESDISFNFARAKNQIRGINDELLGDYSAEMILPKSERFWDYPEHLPELKSALEYKDMFSADDSAPKYPGQLTYNRAMLQYQSPEHSGQLPASSIRSQFDRYILRDDKPASDMTGQSLDNNDVSQMLDVAATEQQISPQTKSAAYFNTLSSFNGELNHEHNASYIPQQEGTHLDSSTFYARPNKDPDVAILHKMLLEIDYLKNRKEENKDETNPITSKDIWSQIDDYPATSQGKNLGNLLSRNNEPSSKVAAKADETHESESSSHDSPPGKETQTSTNLSKKPQNATRLPKHFIEKIREQTGDQNQVVRNRNVKKMKNEDNVVTNISAKEKQRAATTVRYKTKMAYQNKHAALKDSAQLSYYPFDLVDIEKRRGNNAGRSRGRNEKITHHRYVPKPQSAAQPEPQLTTRHTTIVVQSNKTTTSKNQMSTTEFMREIVDRGVDKIDIPLSGSPPWHARIHGRRDIVLAGAIMGGIGLLLIILSMVYFFINRRKSQQKKVATKNNDKEYHRLGTSDEKEGLTKPRHSLFPLSSDENTTEESEDDSKYAKTNITANY